MSVIFDEDKLPYSPLYGDHYFSRHDGRAECNHVFLAGNRLPDRWRGVDAFFIGELGFGTGLNFLQTWAIWCETRTEGQHLTFTSAEAHLVEKEDAEQALSRWPELEPFSAHLLPHWDSLDRDVRIDQQTTLNVVSGEAENTIEGFPMTDAWYLDGFAPAKNPDMWSEDLMRAIAARTKRGGTFASYTAAGWVRRNLEVAGFSVEKSPGFGTKRHMISGVKL